MSHGHGGAVEGEDGDEGAEEEGGGGREGRVGEAVDEGQGQQADARSGSK